MGKKTEIHVKGTAHGCHGCPLFLYYEAHVDSHTMCMLLGQELPDGTARLDGCPLNNGGHIVIRDALSTDRG